MGKQINGSKAKQLIKKGALLFDVRNPVAFRDGTIPGAINLPVSNMSQLVKYPKTSKVIFFGESLTDPNLDMALKYAMLTFSEVLYLSDKDSYFKN